MVCAILVARVGVSPSLCLSVQVIKYESVIHEFDPYFNYRVTQVRSLPASDPVDQREGRLTQSLISEDAIQIQLDHTIRVFRQRNSQLQTEKSLARI